MPGNIYLHTYLHTAYVPHESRGITDGRRYDVITGSWPPNGDRSVFEAPFYLVESFPVQPSTASLPTDFSFHASTDAR